ncbi:hypothetical protein HanPI659440_Chr11g0433491 [Helianthus annuus]|nr:hypothetical protein HanPI659440_Chr11g0433491 [Helianthus annuus]
MHAGFTMIQLQGKTELAMICYLAGGHVKSVRRGAQVHTPIASRICRAKIAHTEHSDFYANAPN